MSEFIRGKQCGDKPKHILLSADAVGRCLEKIAKVLKKQISEKKLHSGRGLLYRQLDESIGVCGVARLMVIAGFCVHNEIHEELSH